MTFSVIPNAEDERAHAVWDWVIRSAYEFYTCWSRLDLGEIPLLLDVRPPGHTMAEHRRILAETTTRLQDRGLFTGKRPSPTLTSMLRVLANPDYTLDIRYADNTHQTDLLGLGAVTHHHTTVVTADSNGAGPLTLTSLDTAHVAAHLLSQIGPITPGRSPTVNIPTDALDRARAAVPDHNPWQIAEHLTAHGVPRADADGLARMCTGIQAAGQLGTTTHTAGHPPRRGPWVIGLHRTVAGHFMQLRHTDNARAATLTVHPTDAQTLQRHWRALVEHTASPTRTSQPHLGSDGPL